MRTALLLLVLLLPPLAAQGTPSDDRIYDEVRRRLALDVDINGGGLEVVVKNGAVILRGRVHTNKAKEKAEKIAKKVKGVTSVDNQLKLFGAD
ncbi:MAG TPA: BON domain-containing protein [Bryobacteraceae bacterium]|nr:BON domain-containing protein [Bryobacteraceae bacterium]